ncbi:MAG: peroxiredoxin [Paraburkholderia sp.]|uniref:peroxiredoxin family protein n=1 Tax=Paraburkholderia sp. TaxID=1926495 RepID=UPI0011FC9302|nr:peroxiredoxin [Paraburkholderia sp.]TAL99862.1 MAG: peroxiredoxin [Paraburkholderia sp.]TAM31639.1 MAG: peroxiredoxin [Paraburkholderia sp.]
MIELGESLPDVNLHEFVEDMHEGCTQGPKSLSVREEAAGKCVVIFGLPRAFTPATSARQVLGYVEWAEAIAPAGIDEIWYVSVSDAFVTGAWGRDLRTAGKVRTMGDGSATFTLALGLEQDLSARGMGIRSLRYAMVVDDGVVKTLDVEAPGKFEVKDVSNIHATLRPE